jgi:2-polyprenyl-3-methyl-5-hydroxy-6-metoxy-1,4-benzoquinol methylase
MGNNIRPGTLLRWQALRPIFKSLIKDNSTVLDIGGYDGFIASKLLNMHRSLKITVADLDKCGLKIAESYGLNTVYASGLDIPVKNSSVDFVLCLDFIEHVEEDFKIIREISRIMKHGGRVFLTTPMEKGISFPFLNIKEVNEINTKWGHIRKGYKLEDIEKLFIENNLTIQVITSCFNVLSRYAYWFAAFSKISMRGKWIPYKLIIRLEPYLKISSEEHIIIGIKVGNT